MRAVQCVGNEVRKAVEDGVWIAGGGCGKQDDFVVVEGVGDEAGAELGGVLVLIVDVYGGGDGARAQGCVVSGDC